jgi:hypothetical protein
MDIPSEKLIQRNENPSQAIVTVKVIFMGELKRWAGRSEVKVELPEGSTIQALGKKLAVLCGEAFIKHVLTKAGAFQPHVALFIDGVHIGELDSAQTVLLGGRVELMLLPSYEGG